MPSLRTLQRRAKAAGQARPRGRPLGKPPRPETQERLDLLAQGLSPQQVAIETDCTPQAVRELRRRYLDED